MHSIKVQKKKFTEYLNINRSRTGLHNTRSSYICNLSHGLHKQCTRQARVGLSHFTKVTNCSLGVHFIRLWPIQLTVMYKKKKNTMNFNNNYNNIASCRCLVSIETEVCTSNTCKCHVTRYNVMVTCCHFKI